MRNYRTTTSYSNMYQARIIPPQMPYHDLQDATKEKKIIATSKCYPKTPSYA
jgi:hypothetical protein